MVTDSIGEKWKATEFIHTHQDKSLNPTPSTYTGSGWGDAGYSLQMGGRPLIAIGHQDEEIGVISPK